MNKQLKLIAQIVTAGLVMLILVLAIVQHSHPELYFYNVTVDYETGKLITTDPLLKTEAPLTYWVYTNQATIFWACVGLALLIVDWKKLAYKISKNA